MSELIAVLDFGGQYKELIARAVRSASVYSEVFAGNVSADVLRERKPIGIILSGGPDSVYGESARKYAPGIFDLGVPVLGICYGLHIMCTAMGGEVAPCEVSEFGGTAADILHSELFKDVPRYIITLMSHNDQVSKVPEGFTVTAKTGNCPVAAFENAARKLYGVQFHPETNETNFGDLMIRNFLFGICGAKGDYSLDDYVQAQIGKIRGTLGGGKVLLALSGGVDSAVCAKLLEKAVPDKVVCVFVDHGFMRYGESDEIEQYFSKGKLEFRRINAKERFLAKIKGVTDPERKRKIIGNEFIAVFEEEARKVKGVTHLAQGTIYPDIIESGGGGVAAAIKSHHNVGGLPENMMFDGLVEPLSGLFKDEVRKIGEKLEMPRSIVHRQPFPGPGLAIRIIGEVTAEKLEILRYADYITTCEIEKLDDEDIPSQYFAVFTGIKSVGVRGDSRAYDYVIAVRAVNTADFMTCGYSKLPHKTLAAISRRIVNEVSEVSRVVFDVTDKPPATVEWE